jgi:arylsulfatase A-like enzyme
VQQVDLMPTVLEAAGVEAPPNLDGKSLWPIIRGEQDGTTEAVFLSECAWQAARGVVTCDYKLIRTMDSGPYRRPRLELYDLRLDPEEVDNAAERLPDVADRMERQLDEWVERMLGGRRDPMEVQLEVGLPFRNRIHQILLQYGLTWDEWIRNPRRERFDRAAEVRHAGK